MANTVRIVAFITEAARAAREPTERDGDEVAISEGAERVSEGAEWA